MTLSDVSDTVVRVSSSSAYDVRRSSMEIAQSRETLAMLKDALGDDGVLSLFREKLKDAESFWTDLVAQSKGLWKESRVQLQISGLTAEEFLKWGYETTFNRTKMLAASPSHLRMRWDETPKAGELGSGVFSIVESIGGVLTYFVLKSGVDDTPPLEPDPRLTHRITNSIQLYSGLEFGRVFHQFGKYGDGMSSSSGRDVPGGVAGLGHRAAA